MGFNSGMSQVENRVYLKLTGHSASLIHTCSWPLCLSQIFWPDIHFHPADLSAGIFIPFRSVQFSHSVVFDSLWPHESQHTRPPCPSPTPGVHSDSCPSSQWCHPAISSSIVPFSSCPQSLPASKSSPMSQLFAWGGQSTGASALASFLPKKSLGYTWTMVTVTHVLPSKAYVLSLAWSMLPHVVISFQVS